MASPATAEPTTPRREPVTAAPITPTGLVPDRPPIAALFLIEFDVKAGYTIVWKQAVSGLDLTGAVEYKSLPSGLHAVSEDLVYFVHEEANNSGDGDGGAGSSSSTTADTCSNGYAGLSAFVNLPTDDASARNARMIAVGVLVPRSYGRLGRAWRHAGALLDMARQLAADGKKVPLLEAYWRNNGNVGASGAATNASITDEVTDRPLLQITDSPLASPALPVPSPMGYRPYPAPFGSPVGHARNRSASDGTALLLPPGHHLSPHHPAWSLTTLLDTFGPLIFPIYRAALLRKRILISTHAPVREVNNFVYNISVLANIPISALDLLEPSDVQLQRIRPLFTIGVNDITFLLDDLAASKRAAREAEAAVPGGSPRGSPNGASHEYCGPGWIACTTDSILAVKAELWDVLITMPPAHQATSPTCAAKDKKVWPTVEIAKGVILKATQRDLRRYKALTAGLERLAGRTFCAQEESYALSEQRAGSGSRYGSRGKLFLQEDAQLVEAAESVVEPVTWAALAYNGFMWWASAGEQSRSEETDETIHDAQLLADIVPPRSPHPSSDAHTGSSSSNLLDSVASLTTRRDTIGTSSGDQNEDEEEERARLELAIITYFHRLTTQTLSVLSDVVESNDDDGDGGYYYDDDEGEDGFDHYNDNEEEADAGAAGNGVGSDGVVGRTGRASNFDGLVSARRSGLAPTSSVAGAASSSTTSLLLRRRSGRSGRASESSSPSSRQLQQRSSTNHSAADYGGILRINSDAVSRMGLDVWSHTDAAFVRDISQQYFGRRGRRVVYVESKGVEVCGFKVC
ncbi:hypothetical protein SBRCBS47491_008745 [Sporothrix bragantina]|uniref:DUF4484 domain-containing protein n=1 Tax=Sporothrix bragantina TaxID=671064 RepID=A0ABP0CRK2_9PEZI